VTLSITSSNANNLTVIRPKLVIGPKETKLIDLFFPAKMNTTIFEEFLFINSDEDGWSETHLLRMVGQQP